MMMETQKTDEKQTRREFLRSLGRGAFFAGLAALCGAILFKRRCTVSGGAECPTCPDLASCSLPAALKIRNLSRRNMVWQLDSAKCVQCGRCATNCVLNPSAVKCVHKFKLCGYCDLCFGYFQLGSKARTSAAENQLCPTGAITRKYTGEEPYYEYTIDESLCIGCGKCVKGCNTFGNGSLYLQVKHNVCLNCNECSIARNCPAQAFKRVPAGQPYLLKS
jgi:electron transport complex protein RnfB